ncbi:hypothetical protein [Sphaerisporangium rubeum]|uniref:Uncharacterized protein n=1 Tax=Sphaerisporangium rubeum TaxID=321317 RepID=A0A7X0ICF2_9ACTN|nr:hypothetical protein [Sphaerisporangium rubeum]MBB6472576.1 hypothetical protein [Sphaerisporangium rubeum]
MRILAIVIGVLVLAAGIAIGVLARRHRRAGKATTFWRSMERLGFVIAVLSGSASLIITLLVLVLERPASPVTEGRQPGRTTGSPPTTAPPGSPRVVIDRQGFALGPPSSFPAPETDKVDLDSGHRGYGTIVEQWGKDFQPDPGGRTDIIIEDGEIHSYDGTERSMVLLADAGSGGYAACRRALAEEDSRVARIPLADLAAGSQVCSRTDQGRTALVTVQEAGQGPVLTIAFTTWER